VFFKVVAQYKVLRPLQGKELHRNSDGRQIPMDVSLEKLEIILREKAIRWKRIPETRDTRKEAITVELLVTIRMVN